MFKVQKIYLGTLFIEFIRKLSIYRIFMIFGGILLVIMLNNLSSSSLAGFNLSQQWRSSV